MNLKCIVAFSCSFCMQQSYKIKGATMCCITTHTFYLMQFEKCISLYSSLTQHYTYAHTTGALCVTGKVRSGLGSEQYAEHILVFYPRSTWGSRTDCFSEAQQLLLGRWSYRLLSTLSVIDYTLGSFYWHALMWHLITNHKHHLVIVMQ